MDIESNWAILAQKLLKLKKSLSGVSVKSWQDQGLAKPPVLEYKTTASGVFELIVKALIVRLGRAVGPPGPSDKGS
jgi:hypothetical protein